MKKADRQITSPVFIPVLLMIFLCIPCLAKAQPDKGYTPKSIDINKADTTVFISLPGIGSRLASRIVNYREKLGGFISVEQVGETFGLPDSTFEKIKPWLTVSSTAVQKININRATPEQLKTPYINFNLANIIYQYRLQHGLYKSLADLKKIMLIDEVLFNKITPYLTVE